MFRPIGVDSGGIAGRSTPSSRNPGAVRCRPASAEISLTASAATKILTDAIESDDEEDIARVRQIIEAITGGKIMVHQAGPRKRQGGWLKGVFKVHILRYVAERCGVRTVADNGTDVEIEFRRLPNHERIADEVKALWDAGLKYTEIAGKIGCSRNLVARAIAYWHESRGLPAPDGRKYVNRPKRRPRLAERISDDVVAMVNDDVPLGEIAERLNTSRNRITESIRIWRQHRGLPALDGRTLRKERNQRKRSA